jgi:ComF family protein
MSKLAALWQTLQYHLNPDCAFCGLPRIKGYPLCEPCHADLPWLDAAEVPPLPDCPASISAFAYQAPISNLLLRVKFGKNLREVATLGALTATGILPQLTQVPEAILPVPLHPARLHKRGFNQALELARPLAQQLRIPLLAQQVQRDKFTLPQTELDAEQRQHNLQHAFRIHAKLPYRHVAIFDDVITTGATARELAALLLANGVHSVEIWSCARTVLRQKQEVTAQIDYHNALLT